MCRNASGCAGSPDKSLDTHRPLFWEKCQACVMILGLAASHSRKNSENTWFASAQIESAEGGQGQASLGQAVERSDYGLAALTNP